MICRRPKREDMGKVQFLQHGILWFQHVSSFETTSIHQCQESTMQINEAIGCFFSAKAAKADPGSSGSGTSFMDFQFPDFPGGMEWHRPIIQVSCANDVPESLCSELLGWFWLEHCPKPTSRLLGSCALDLSPCCPWCAMLSTCASPWA